MNHLLSKIVLHVIKMEIATFAAGCFWGVEEEFSKVIGVLRTSVGYTGGETNNPTYNKVCSGLTGHAEAVNVEFDPKIVSYDELLEVFWCLHDPTTKDKQGPDYGTQYRSAIFYHNNKQKQQAEISKLNHQKKLTSPIVTEIVSYDKFFMAEDYHQQYFKKAQHN
jgi:peptide-methionine (S)-S-oxide reductase